MSKVSLTSVEMETLCLALEDMADSVKENILNEKEKSKLQQKLLEKENEGLRKDELLAQSELKLLQNQINPHFFFNTLNMICKTAYSEGAYDTADAVAKTSELLRYALDKASKTSDLYSEIESIENYIYIQKKRFQSRINFLLEVAEDIPNIQVPGLLIQPLLENAVKHGLSDMLEGGEVVTDVHMVGDNKLIVSISDNGKGMETVILEKSILNDFQLDSQKKSLGLYNVIQRIRMFYGNNAKVSFHSYPSCGFEVIIEIKVEEDMYV